MNPLKGWVPGRLARNALWAMAGNVARIGVQALYFVLIARSLGPANYGEFASVAALVALFSAFAGYGSALLLMQQVSRDATVVREYWGRSLGLVLMVGTALVAVVLALAPWVVTTGIPRTLVVVVAVTDLLLMPMHLLCTFIFQARERLAVSTALQVGLAVLRLASIGTMFKLVDAPAALDLGWFYLAATAVAVVLSTSLAAREYGVPRLSARGALADLRQSLHFSSSSVAQYVTANLDKVVLARVAGPGAVGIYSVAQRVTEVATMPVIALLAAAMPRLFREGQQGAAGSFTLALRLLPALLAYAAVASVGLYFVAPWLPLLVGARFGDSVAALQLLALMPLLVMFYALAGDAMSGAGRQKLRSFVDMAAAVLNAALNAWWIPQHSYLGAAWALMASFAFSGVVLWSAGLWLARRRPAGEVAA